MLSQQRRVADPEYGNLPVVFEDIGMAAFRIRNAIKKTECLYSETLSKLTGCELYFKHDHRQHTGSFKERGALNTLLLLSPEQRKKGVIAASAGNHALGLSYHAQRLGIPATVVMPVVAPLTKVSKCKEYGAEVHLHGENIQDAKEHAMTIVEKSGKEYINGYDHPGAGTVGLEIIEQVPDVEVTVNSLVLFQAVLIPVGGGGLIAGMSLSLKMLHPDVTVIGVEAANGPSFTKALQEGRAVHTPLLPSLADGLAVPTVGENAFQIARKFVDKVVTVRERYIALAVLRMLEVEKTVVEGGGVIGLAPLLSGQLPELQGKKVVVCLCGGNIDTTVLGRVIERGLAADGRLIQFEVTISDRPGGLAAFTRLIASTGASVKDLQHERAFIDTDLMTITARCVVETRDSCHARELFERLTNENYTINLQTSSLHVLSSAQKENYRQMSLDLRRATSEKTVVTLVDNGMGVPMNGVGNETDSPKTKDMKELTSSPTIQSKKE